MAFSFPGIRDQPPNLRTQRFSDLLWVSSLAFASGGAARSASALPAAPWTGPPRLYPNRTPFLRTGTFKDPELVNLNRSALRLHLPYEDRIN